MTFTTNSGVNSFDILINNLFDQNSDFSPLDKQNVYTPLNLYLDNTLNRLVFEFAVLDIPTNEVDIEVEDDILRVSYQGKRKISNPDEDLDYLINKISKKQFSYAWRINPKFDLKKIMASKNDGILTIEIPRKKETLPEKVKIEIQ